ncbi:AAA family ATPase [Pseudonocardia thermophila]|uniref:AAA family ATPase n=1 Tax=Pseudonocardia thermophila TaxID=1848 RepID=UPI00248D7000|nr:AAA family ATPase [Pseudonocardia thermophila]
MRPVLLEMTGFAAFREHTLVDFTGADYFALVGPTGSGKSTVIDALTFALYGSVPRWDNPRSVANALAPTQNRGAVRLVFDVGGDRYVVARELRRAASGSVSVRGARLERLRDPSGTGAAEEETEPIADGAGDTTAAVTQLLGLTFADFCTCVVLPQGEFAEFLHAEPRKRQEKLVRLLGLDVYERIAKEANAEAAAQRQRAEVLEEQLAGYADATAEAEQAAAARVAELEALAERVAAAVPELSAALAEQRGAAERLDRLHDEIARLSAVRAPEGLAELGARRASAVEAARRAAAALARAEEADTAARAALAAEPPRARLERVLHDHEELAAAVAELPGAQDRLAKATSEYAVAERDAVDALAAQSAARAAVDAAVAAHRSADEHAQRLRAERAALRGLTAPAGLDALRGREEAAVREHERAVAELAAAERAEAAARAAGADVLPRAVLDRVRRDLADLAAAEQAHTAAAAAVEQARRTVDAAATTVTAARERRDHARAAHTAAVRSGLAATLRASLVAGEECPVCAQTVATVPPADEAPETDTEARLSAAEQEHERATAAHAAAVAALSRAEAEVTRQAAVVERLQAGLAETGITTEAAHAAAVAALDRVEAEQQRAAVAVTAARTAVTTAAAAVEDVRAEAARAAAALRAARDPLVPFGAPAAEDDPFSGWAALLEWAAAEAAEREAQLPAATAAAAAAEQERFSAEEALRAAERAVAERRSAETAAARAEQEARAAVAAIERRIEALRAALDGAPSPQAAQAALARVTAAERAAEAADAELRAARREQRIADTAAADVERAVAAGWRVLRAARDPLVALGAPELDEGDGAAGGLPEAWAALLGWAETARAERAAQVEAAERAAAAARERVGELARRLTAELAEHGVIAESDGFADELAAEPTRAITAVATGATRARAAHERIVERRAAVADLVAERDRAEEAHQVAKMLGGLLRSDQFPRWLVASALDALVTDASRSLAELSGGQFELTHDNGEFLVVDHADADSRRPVKTLSGGETFQASLALALALSAQISNLAATGAARLESIFLDEGFGTLDDTNLDVVASTLENLAAAGDRMVGVITHVPALAERVPVRFAVRRDQRTATVERESP